LEFTHTEHNDGERTVLVASGDAELLQEFRAAAESAGAHAITLTQATELPARAKALQPVAILIDQDCADATLEDGNRVLESLKTGSYTASLPLCIVLPSGADEEAQLATYRRGADDAFARPHSAELLRARLKASIRRPRALAESTGNLVVGEVSLDLSARRVSVAGNPVVLTRKEFDLLNMLLRRKGTVVYTTQLYHTVWGHGGQSAAAVDAHTVKVHVSSLRGKLGRDLGRKIVNLPGLGYRFDA
jgi:two-component system KDP operon response regulator KdpE